ncbi:CAP domain-containing protein [Microbacterium sp. KSW-18]|uniref:CAP domain-containing protein n=1 Tax=Microbacterium aquilitoris TaxID=3067307 RepID=A0ABU3GM86_9MICO|nr:MULTISPECIES: CAP domain-containing protein [unclassified Microbacterium]MDT3331811.1 CAP domain-containing protein [Microbacterium sp. KSW-18]
MPASPRVRRRSALALTAALALGFAVVPAGAASAAVSTSCTGTTQAAVQKRILTDVNAARKAGGKKALTLSSAMSKVAVTWSGKQAAANRMSHNPKYSSQIPSGWTRAGENVAFGYAPSKVTPAWMKSAGHRANILGSYNRIGIGVACSSKGLPFYTQVFGYYPS